MGIRELYHLQCVEQNLAESEQGLAKLKAEVGESPALRQAKLNLSQAKAELNAIKNEQKEVEYAIADISAKMAVANESLYSGRIKNPKELQSLQHEITSLQSQRNPLEEKDLSLMERSEASEVKVRTRSAELAEAEAKWQAEQQKLISDIKAAGDALETLKQKRAGILAAIPAADLAMYNQVKKAHGWGLARVEQGTCGRCRLTLSTAELQRARTGQTVACSSCGRLLFFD